MDTSTMLPFVAASVALLLIPGPSVTYIVTRSLQGGRRMGLASVAGVHLGTVVHVMAAVVGLSAILVSSASAYTIIRYAGGLYLIYLGIRALRTRSEASSVVAAAPVRFGKAMRDGFVVNLLNPKTAIFFLAYLPQFARPDGGPLALQLFLLGAVFILIGLITDSMYALGAAEVGQRIGGARWLRRRNQVAGVMYMGLGLLTLASPGRRSN